MPLPLTPLFDGRPGLRGSIPVEIRNPESSIEHPASATLDFISSDPTLDRYHEIISPAGWQLATYQKNPVFQNAHQYGDIIFTLGRALITEVRQVRRSDAPRSDAPRSDACLFQRIQFAVDANPMAKIAHALYKDHFLNAVSVGFIPLRWEDGDLSSSSSSSSSSSPPYRRRYLEQELLEVSAVAIPANPNALALAYKSGALEKCDLKETAALLTDLASSHRNAPGASPPGASPPGGSPPGPSIIHHPPSLLDLAHEIRDLLKRV